MTAEEYRAFKPTKPKVKYKVTRNNPEQLKSTDKMIIATMGIAIDYHYFQTESQVIFAEKSLIKQGFEVEIIETYKNKAA